MRKFKESISKIPVYNDGKFNLFVIKQTETDFPIEYIIDLNNYMFFREISISDKLKFESDKRKVNLTLKIRIPQNKEINSLNVVKINEKYHKVYNAYHFINEDGYPETDLTLISYDNPRIGEIQWLNKNYQNYCIHWILQ